MNSQPGTLIQFARAIREDYFNSHSDLDVSRAEYDRLYPRESRMQDWVNAIYSAARNGETISPRALDDLFTRCERVFWSLHHDHERAIPEGYLPPPIRRLPRVPMIRPRIRRARKSA